MLKNSLSSAEVKAVLSGRAHMMETWLETCLDNFAIPENLRAAMKYSLLAGGKRLRPVLCLTTAELCGLAAEKILPFAGALECIHTYSLIHDDLPAMDDDDLRRGRPSCHKAFDEATAILAGDALLTDAFFFMASLLDKNFDKNFEKKSLKNRESEPSKESQDGKEIPPERLLAAIATVAQAAGSRGMVGGQVLDIESTGKTTLSQESLRHLDALKTGAMFRVSCATGGILANANFETVDTLCTYGENLGAAFQIVDDILDATEDTATLGKPAGSDAEKGKLTWISVVGLDRSRDLAKEAAEKAIACLSFFDSLADPYPQKELAFLKGLALYLLSRIN